MRIVRVAAVLMAIGVGFCVRARAQTGEPALRQHDRGAGMATSENGIYADPGALLVLTGFEYAFDHDREYQPASLGFPSSEDRVGSYHEAAGLLFIALGVTDWLEVEVQGAYADAALGRDAADDSGLPARTAAVGLADLEGELRVRALAEGPTWPEVFVFLNGIAPSQGETSLIGDPSWDLKIGLGFTKAYRWGTMSFRTVFEWNREDRIIDIGESALEYLRRLSSSWRVYAGIEGGEGGAPDEWYLNLGAQWFLNDYVSLRVAAAVGITPKATDIEAHVGLLVSLPVLPSAHERAAQRSGSGPAGH